MNIIELIRRRVEALRASTNQNPIEVVNNIIDSDPEKTQLIQTGPFLGVQINIQLLNEALSSYRNELQRVVAMQDGIFREPGMENGYTLSENEDTCWGTYYNKLISERRNPDDLQRIMDECNVIVQQFLPQPAQNPDRRGLVIGQVQSGKTTIFNGVISTAADMGFNLIFILSGTLESLRRQTQKRIAGDVTGPWGKKNNTPFYFTWISNHEGPGLKVAGSASQVLTDLSNEGRRQVAVGVFLKNATVLNNLRGFLNTINPADYPNIRALIIDDEADQATPNAGVNRNTISAINRAVKSLVIPNEQNRCSTQGRTSYLGFTATPFANLLNEAGPNTLYPKDFLYFLRSSNRYFGPWQLFGNPDEVEGEETIISLDVIRHLTDNDIAGTVPQTGRPRPPYHPIITNGLRDALRWYVLASAMRRISQADCWSTMLIHTSSRTSDHVKLYEAIKDFNNNLYIDWSRNKTEWKRFWEQEIERVSLSDIENAFPSYGTPEPIGYPEWSEIEKHMPQVITDIKIKIDNSLYTGADRIAYNDEAPSSERLQIAIGGNTLSRGLTLEGLVSSYFARRFTAQSGYDTLLQMGRWFGFRQGYELLSRLWTTSFLENAFRDLVIMELDLRKTMQLYLQGQSPANKAPIITRMPAMAITRKSIFGNTQIVSADFSGTAPQTILFKNESNWLKNNFDVTSALLSDLNNLPLEREEPSNKIIYRNVPINLIIDFIRSFNFWPHSNTFNKKHMLDFIERNEQTYQLWSVVIFGGRTDTHFEFPPCSVNMLNRSRIKDDNEPPAREVTFINLKSLRATRDLLCDRLQPIPPTSREEDLWAIRQRENLNPVLAIYPINKDSTYDGTSKFRIDLKAVEHIIGITLIMNPPGAQQGAIGIQLDLNDVYTNDEDADDNPDLSDNT